MKLRTRSTPYMVNTGRVTLTVSRSPGVEYVRGRPVEVERFDVEVEGNVQPMFRYTSTVSDQDGQRHKVGLKVFALSRMVPAKEGNKVDIANADTFLWDGEEFVVWECGYWGMGIMDHWEVVALKRADL